MSAETIIEAVLTSEIILQDGSPETVIEPVIVTEIVTEEGSESESVVETLANTELVTENITEMVIETIAQPELITENIGPPGPVSALTQEAIDRFDQTLVVLFGGEGNSLASIVQAVDARLATLGKALAGDQITGLTTRTEIRAEIASNHADFVQQTDVFVSELEALATTTTLHAASIGDNTSAILEEATARATADGANATLISEVAVQAAEATGSGLWKLEAIAAPSGVTVRLAALARVNTLGTYVQSGFLIDIIPAGGGLYRSEIAMLADRFILTNGTGKTTPFVYSGGVVYIDTAMIRNLTSSNITAGSVNADRLIAGSIMAAQIGAGQVNASKISVGSLEAISATLGNVTINGALVINGTLYTEKYAGNSILSVGFSINTGDFSINSGYSNVCSVGLSTYGGKVLVTVAISYESRGQGDQHARVAIAKNGSVVLDEAVATVLNGKYGGGTLIWVDNSPGVGSNTYQCYSRTTSSNLTHIFSAITAENHKNA